MENIWGIIAQHIYADKKQYNSIAELKLANLEALENFEMDILKNLVASMPKKTFQTIKCARGSTDY